MEKALKTQNQPYGLRCELLKFPEKTKIKTSEPLFSWIVPLKKSGNSQQAYQIMVATESKYLENDAPDIWESGNVKMKRVLILNIRENF